MRVLNATIRIGRRGSSPTGTMSCLALCKRECLHGRGFTRYNLCAYALCACTKFAWTDLHSVVTCTSWGVCTAFCSSALLDRSAFRRLAAQTGVSMPFFHVANLVVHLLPCIATLIVRPYRMDWWHGLVAIAAHLAWGVAVSDGTLCLDNVYVPMPASAWYALWTIAVTTEAMACLLSASPRSLGALSA